MTPPDEPPTNPYDPNRPPPEQPYGQPSEGATPYGQPPEQAPSDQPSDPQPYAPYGQQPPAQAPYGQAPYGQAPYGQAPQGQVPYGQPQYGVPSYAGIVPAHPSASTAMILGIISLVGFFTCFLAFTLFLAPFAWVMGGRAVKEIDANPGRFSGREQAQAGRIMGMIGSALLALSVLGFILVIIGTIVGASESDSYDSSYYYSDSDF